MSANYLLGKWLSRPEKGEEVVISGMAGRFPECENIAQFKERLSNKEDMITEDCKARWDGNMCLLKRGGRLPEINRFDCGFFGVHYRQSKYMDPMTRIFLETAIESIIDAGINLKELEGSKTGVFVASIGSDNESKTLFALTQPQNFGIIGYMRSFAAHRLSYFLKLKGPSYALDTACSSSLNTLEHALKCIRSGECDNAIVGCTNLTIHPVSTNNFFRLGVLTPDGIPKVFDEKADGYVRSETIGSLFLQKTKDARRIYGTIIHAKVNDDGYKHEGITFPSPQAQSSLIKEVYEESGLDVNELSYFEAHATGTKVGDPQEVEAIDIAIGQKRKIPLWIGSVKSSIGHTEPSSGFCSICKVLIAFETGKISPNIHFHKTRPDLEPFSSNRLKVVTETIPLTEENALIGVNNFGFGGNNAHVVLRRYPKGKIKAKTNGLTLEWIICVSGRTEKAVQSLIQEIKNNSEDLEYFTLLQHVFSRNVYNHSYKGYVILPVGNSSLESIKFTNECARPPLNLIFGNLDKCYKNVGRSLLYFPVFSSALTKSNICYFPKLDILELIQSDLIDSSSDIIAGFCVQIGIIEMLKVLGLDIANCYGISPLGELVAGYFKNEVRIESIVNFLCKGYHGEAKFGSGINGMRDKYKLLKGFLVFSDDYEICNATYVRLSFLELFGSLYQEGHELKLYNLYPHMQLPVSRSTPMISPSILWDHSKQWRTYKYDQLLETKTEEREFKLNCNLEDDKYLLGHVVDGRNLFPAAGFLWLVWNTLAQSRDFLAQDLPVVFENCKFVRAVTIPSNGKLYFSVTIQRGSGSFEVIHDNSAVVTGIIYIDPVPELSKESPESSFSVENPELSMNQDEIYRELNLRGYNYSGLFRGIQKCSVDASKGVIQWNNNWITLLDNMFQLQILLHDTRLLYVPIGVQRLSIDPVAHLKIIAELGEEPLLPIACCKSTHSIESAAVQIKGLVPHSIQRRKHLNEPVLEKYMFVPNVTNLALRDALQVIVQIILENSLAVVFNAVEKLAEESEAISPIVCEVLQEVPLIKADLTILTKNSIETTHSIKVESVSLGSDSKLLLIGSKIISNTQSVISVKEEGFILSREDLDFDGSCIDSTTFTILLVIITNTEKLILLRRNIQRARYDRIVQVTADNFNWIPDLQKYIDDGSRVVVYSQNEPLSGILGLMNCLRREKNGSNLQCFFIIDATAPTFDLNHSFFREQLLKNFAFNVLKNKTWGTYRHLLLDEYNLQLREHAFVNVLDKGNLKSLTWLEGPLRFGEENLGTDKTLVIPYYCALNFRDIMTASGRINADAFIPYRILQECVQGFEFAGRTLDGKRVMGFGTGGALASLVKADSYFLFDVPQDWSLEDAATTTVVYSTLIYGLIFRSNCLKSGKSILIHCGAGGIGIAAINMALHYDMEVFTTVGTPEKRDFIMKRYPQLKETQVGNSRDTSFFSLIKKATKGRGVDVVLNSLTAEKLYASIDCLAIGGSFIEIGKFDLIRNSPLYLRLMAKEASFHGVMLDRLFFCDVNVKKEFTKYIDKALGAGFVKPLPRTVFSGEEIENAFRYMSTGKHLGKVLIRLRKEELQEVSIPTKKMCKALPRFYCSTNKVQIIIGGLGGVGLELIDYLVLRGATKVLISSRNGINSSYQQQRINIWTSYGVKIIVSTADITTRSGCEQLLTEGHNFGVIEGIFNLGAVLKDAAFEKQTSESFNVAFGPKVLAVQYLDEFTRRNCLDLRFFVVFSSVACGRGNPGQTNYAMANSIMERICEKRKLEGFPALAIQWGAIGEVGLVAKMKKELQILKISGTLQQRISNCLSLLDRFLNQDHPIVSSMVVAEKRRDLGSGTAVEAVVHILGIKDPKSVVPTTPLSELGMDSITGTEIYQVLEKEFEIYVKPEDMKNLTFEKLNQLEVSKATAENNLEQKTTLAMSELLRFLPDAETGHLPILEMVSRNNKYVDAPLMFVLPGIEGLLSDLESVTKDIEAKILGLQYDYKDPAKTVSETADKFLPHIEEKLGTSRNFYILGYSFGVLVSLEIAFILESRGYHGTIFAIDGSPAYTSTSIRQFTSVENETAFQISAVLQILKHILPIDIVEANKDIIINAKSKEERFDAGAMLIKRRDSPNHEFEKIAIEAVFNRYQAALTYEYMHKDKIKSCVNLFRVTRPIVEITERDYGFSHLVEDDVVVSEIDADHITVLKQVSIANDINKVLAKSI